MMYTYEYTLTRNNRLTTDWASRQKNIIKLINESHAPICHNQVPKKKKIFNKYIGLAPKYYKNSTSKIIK